MADTDVVSLLRAELELSKRLLADAQALARIGSWEWDLATNVVTLTVARGAQAVGVMAMVTVATWDVEPPRAVR